MLPAYCLDELTEVTSVKLGCYPPLWAQVAEASATVLPAPLPSSALNQADEPTQSPWALPTETVSLTVPEAEEQLELDNWCQPELAASPSDALPASDGSMMPLSEDEVIELTDHVNSGRLTKSNLCRGCLQSERPRRIHRSVRDLTRPLMFYIVTLLAL